MVDFVLIGGRIVILTALLVSIYRYKQLRKTSLRNFGYYFAFVILIETVAYFSSNRRIDSIFYTIYDIGMYSFFILWFYELFDRGKFVLRLLGIYFILLMTSLVLEVISKPLVISQTGGTLILLYLTILFYARLLKSNDVIAFLEMPEFWITIGLLIFNLGYLPLSFAIKLEWSISRDVTLLLSFFTNAVLYLCFIKAMLCPVKK